MVTSLSPADHDRVTAAVTAAEATTDGEIVTVVAPRSDAYRDVVQHWALLAALAVPAVAAVRPDWLVALRALPDGGWVRDYPLGELLTLLLALATLAFLSVRFVVGVWPVRLALTPRATKARRVRARAIDLFRVGVETHTTTRTGVLLYLSLAERRAEIVADAAVHAAVPPERWGDILADLVDTLRLDRAGDAMVAAVAAIGATLATHFPATGRDTPELPDRLIQL